MHTCIIPVTSVCHSSISSWNLFVGGLIGGVSGVPRRGSGGGLELDEVDQLTGLISSGPEGTLHTPRDDSLCPIL